MVNQETQLCLDSNYHDPKAANPEQGAVYGENCNGGTYQKWNLASVSEGVNLIDQQTGKCLDSDYNRAAYTLPCSGSSYQKWHIFYNARGYLVIQSAQTEYYLRRIGSAGGVLTPEEVATGSYSTLIERNYSWL